MSLINQVLQDLDRRNAQPAPGARPLPPEVKPVPGGVPRGHEWFWRTLALLVLAAVTWIGWVLYEIRPRSIATELALSHRDAAARRAAPSAVPLPAPAPPVAQAPAAPAPLPPASEDAGAAPPPAPPELFKLALAIDTPIRKAAEVAGRRAPPAPAERRPAPAASTEGIVSKRVLEQSPDTRAEALFRQGVALLNQGRITEAQAAFSAAVAHHPAHEPARQALIATWIERRELASAERLLQEGLALNPRQAQFATVLARIQIERGDYAAAERILASAGGAGAGDADFQMVRGAVLQRLGRHGEAADAFERVAKMGNQPAVTWVALGISLEAVGRAGDALEAYRRGLRETLPPDVRHYAHSRARLLQ